MKLTILIGEGGSVRLQIEGRVAGLQVHELHRAWQGLAPTLGPGMLSVDLRGVTFVDAAGKQALAEIHSRMGAEFLADTPLTKYFAEQAQLGFSPITE